MSLVDHLPPHLTVNPLFQELDSRFTLEDDSLLSQVADAPALTPQDWGVKLYLLGQLQISGLDSEKGIRSLQKSIEYLMACQALDCAARVALLLGRIFLETGRIDDAEQALEIIVGPESTTATWKEIKTQVDFLMARIKYERGEIAESLKIYHGLLLSLRSSSEAPDLARCFVNMGGLYADLGKFEDSVGYLLEAYKKIQGLPERLALEFAVLVNLTRVKSLSGEHESAIDVAHQARESAEHLGDPHKLAFANMNLGEFLLSAGRPAEAVTHLTRAFTLSDEHDFRNIKISVLGSLCALHEGLGQYDLAAAEAQQALTLALEVGSAEGEIEARIALGRLFMQAGDLAQAEPQLLQALELARTRETPKEQVLAHEQLVQVYRRSGQLELALEHADLLRTIERSIFDTDRDRQIRNLTVLFEVERAQQEAQLYRLRSEVEQEAREAAEQQVLERTAELARAQHEVVARLAIAAEYRDDTTGEHTRRVGQAAARIARALGWSETQASVLGVAARLHDVGKIAIPDAILLKRGRLTPDEFRQMQSHTVIGSRILSGSRSALLTMAEEIARSHHERWDGSGYPHGLAGNDIPLTGRIVAIADVFDALIQSRPYKAAWTTAEALREIQAQAGRHFDPELVAVAADVLASLHQEDSLFLNLYDGQQSEPLAEGEASHVLAVFEQLLVERTRELELARREAERSARRMERMALTDSLTDLRNRRAFEQDLEGRAAPLGNTPFTVLSLDVDGLKRLNDTHGHSAGDDLLSAVAAALTAAFAGHGQAYRIGGDEFAVIGEAVMTAAEQTRCLSAMAQHLQQAGYPDRPFSTGAADYPADSGSAGDLLRISDQRMYRDKVLRRQQRPAQPLD
ncbi:HD domain-containing phosphohydrolase [Deinococcus sp. 23YEL01]|uniref:HD domain-containing phosphohydrolase n=1 Tax=Deinococcus sp. 23YEL01 TaxID=2745871 RepID=UPI00351DA4B3|nr:diguanylate cyclase [Deinococcus sp. 23YEL01]